MTWKDVVKITEYSFELGHENQSIAQAFTREFSLGSNIKLSLDFQGEYYRRAL